MPISRIEFHKPSNNTWVGAEERDPTDEDGLRLIGAGPTGAVEVMYADIPGNSWNPQRLSKFVDRANQLLVKRIPLADLPTDDPDKIADPDDYPRLYWDGGDLCSRTIEVSNATFLNGQLDFVIKQVG